MRKGVFLSVSDAVLAAQGAYNRYSDLKIDERQEIIEGIRKALLPKAEEIARMTVEETGLGNVPDKVKKLLLAINKTPGTEDLITEVSTGDRGMTLYELSSYGVICAVHPCTNPCATLINNTISMLAAGNAVVHCPHPRAANVSKYVTELIADIIGQVCGIDNLAVTLDESLMIDTKEVMSHPDIAVVVTTGGSDLLRQAMSCGKKVIGAGPANPVSIVDETADIRSAARDIVKGASFDHNLMCITEKSIVVVESAAEELIWELEKNGAIFIKDKAQINQLASVAVTADRTVSRCMEGKHAKEILKAAQLTCEREISLIVCETHARHPFATVELLMPLIPLIRVTDFDEALKTALEIEQNYRHTAIIHSQSIRRLNETAKKMQTSVFIKNGSSLAGIGYEGEGSTSFTIATATGEGTTTARHFARRRRCTLTDGFSIR